jgi:transposase
MARPTRYPQEIRERAMRMVAEHRGEYPSEWAAVSSIAGKLGMTPETLRIWIRRAEVDGGQRGLTTEERERMKALERENRELRRANEILKAASAFFAYMTPLVRPGELAPFFAAQLNLWLVPEPPLARFVGPSGVI